MPVLVLVAILGGVVVLCIVAEFAFAMLDWLGSSQAGPSNRHGRTENQRPLPAPLATSFRRVSRLQETFHELQSASCDGDPRWRPESRTSAVRASSD